MIQCNVNRIQLGKIGFEKQNRNIKNSHSLTRESGIDMSESEFTYITLNIMVKPTQMVRKSL